MKRRRSQGLAALVGLLILWATWRTWQTWALIPALLQHEPRAYLWLALSLGWLLPAGVGVLAPRQGQRALRWLLRQRERWIGARGLLLFGGLVFWPWLVIFSPVAGKWASLPARWLTFGLATASVALASAPRGATRLTWRDGVRGGLLAGAAFAFLAPYANVSSYPFSLTWSEGNTLWVYSLPFARQRYLYPPDQPIFAYLDPGRQWLGGLVFLLPQTSIWAARLWNAILFTVPPLLLSWVVFASARLPRRLILGLTLWGFLFLRQGPVYPPLLLSALAFVVAAQTPWWLGLLLAGCGAYYAAITRFTWVVAPLVWGVLIGLALSSSRRGRAQGWAVLAGALGGTLISGQWVTLAAAGLRLIQKHLPGHLFSSLAPSPAPLVAGHPLLWARLWPNATFKPGLILGILLASAPLWLAWRTCAPRHWPWRRAAAWIAGLGTGVLLLTGLVVSLKAGGGDNLHNFDMYLVTLLIETGWGIYALKDRINSARLSPPKPAWLWGAVLVPMYFLFLATPPRSIPNARWWKPALKKVRHLVQEAHAQGGEVLFMDQRQLLTFGFVDPVPLVAEYEKTYLMDQAMAANEAFFAAYYRDLAHQRFTLIISEPLEACGQTTEEGFAFENNAWVQWVVLPTLQYYRPLATFGAAGVQILIPRDQVPTSTPP